MSITRDWRERALCVGADPEMFTAEGDPAKHAWPQEARDICNLAPCPVKAECLAAAVKEKDGHSMRGGLTPQERAAGRPKLPPTPVPIVHGTATGALLHYRRGTKPCEPCRAAARRDKKAREEQAARKATA